MFLAGISGNIGTGNVSLKNSNFSSISAEGIMGSVFKLNGTVLFTDIDSCTLSGTT
jgi:hypothetical protein